MKVVFVNRTPFVVTSNGMVFAWGFVSPVVDAAKNPRLVETETAAASRTAKLVQQIVAHAMDSLAVK